VSDDWSEGGTSKVVVVFGMVRCCWSQVVEVRPKRHQKVSADILWRVFHILAEPVPYKSVFENTYFTFIPDFKKHDFLYVFFK